MGEKRQIVREYVAGGLKVSRALTLISMTKNQYYHRRRSSAKRVGRPVTTHTDKHIGNDEFEKVEDQEVVDQMEEILKDEDAQYGYKRMTAAMMLLGYKIGVKKVMRLMRMHGLLQARRRSSGKRRVRARRVDPGGPLEVLSMDIKQVWVEEHARSAYILTVIDTFTRATLGKAVGYQMTQHEVKKVWEQVIVNYLQPAGPVKQGHTHRNSQ